MLITCPTCASSYRIKAAKIGPEGRSVRCAACRETWFLTPADAVEDDEAPSLDPAVTIASDPVADEAWAEAASAVRDAAGSEDPAPPEAEPPPSPRKRAAKRATSPKARPKARKTGGRSFPVSPAATLGLVLLAAVPLLCLARTGVVGVLPRTAPLFSAIGLPVNRRGLEIRDVVAFQNPAQDDHQAELVIEGDLVGVGRGAGTLPGLLVQVSDATGKLLRTFVAPAPRPALAAGEAARFRARLADPPAEGRAVTLRFASASSHE